MMSSNKSGREGVPRTFMTAPDVVNIEKIDTFTEDSTTLEILNAYLRVLSFKLDFSDSIQPDQTSNDSTLDVELPEHDKSDNIDIETDK